MSKKTLYFLYLLVITIVFSACSSARFLQEEETLLHSVKLKSKDKTIRPASYRNYIRQEPNSRWFNLLKVPLGLYCLSGKDSTKTINKFFRRIGQAPQIYNPEATQQSLNSLQLALINKGYLHAQVTANVTKKHHHTNVTYEINAGPRSIIRSINLSFDTPEIEAAYIADSSASLLHSGMPMDVSILTNERTRIVTALQNRGFYLLNKEFITFKADSSSKDFFVDLIQTLARPSGIDSTFVYQPFHLGQVHIYDRLERESSDSIYYKGLWLHYKGKPTMHRNIYSNHTFLHPKQLYREKDVQQTYNAFNTLDAVDFSTIQLQPNYTDSTKPLLDASIIVNPAKRQSLSMELEGTNTSGNLGAAMALTYTNKNAFRRATALSLKFRLAYEAISGLEGYDTQSYLEYGTEISLRKKSTLVPLTRRKSRQSFKTFSEVSLQYNSQDRPEFHKRLLATSWRFQWQQRNHPEWRHRWDFLELNYVFMPWISETFRRNYLENTDNRYSVLRYSYENLLIMKTGYGFTYNSSQRSLTNGLYNTNDYQIRFNVETAGNFFYLLSRLSKAKRDNLGQYTLFNNAFSQYAKFDFDYAKSLQINPSNSLAFHAALGLALPYGNASYIPYEKRYFSGGANSVRGWGVRELGPGSFVEKDGKINFINQTGNIKLDLNIEYRTTLFWKFLGAAFIDAGNIWNTRAYRGIETGQFKFKNFYKQIAVGYGIGLRFNFDYFILRLDAGMKAIHPAYEKGKEKYPIFHPKFGRDLTLHFAIGLPF